MSAFDPEGLLVKYYLLALRRSIYARKYLARQQGFSNRYAASSFLILPMPHPCVKSYSMRQATSISDSDDDLDLFQREFNDKDEFLLSRTTSSSSVFL